MVHPETYIKDTPKGLGLFAGRRFQRGEIIWLTDDLDAKIPLKKYLSLTSLQRNKLNTYSYLDDKNRVVVPWDEGKYVNHSCGPNSTSLLEFDNISIALGDIEPDEEIVEDYYCYYGHFETFVCQCGAPKCRGLIQQANTYHSELRLRLSDIAAQMASLPQLLLSIRSAESEELKQVLRAFAVPA